MKNLKHLIPQDTVADSFLCAYIERLLGKTKDITSFRFSTKVIGFKGEQNCYRTFIKHFISKAEELGLIYPVEGTPTILIKNDNNGNFLFGFLISGVSSYSSTAKIDIIYQVGQKHNAMSIWRNIFGHLDCDATWKTIVEFYYSRGNITTTDYRLDDMQQPIIYDELYPTIDPTKLVQAYLESNDSILVLYGEPGTGKTSLIKKLIYSCPYRDIAYIKDTKAISQSELWTTIKGYKLIILDDLDASLTADRSSSDKEANMFMSNLLSFSDGITNPFERPKIVISTNTSLNEIDSALIRPGRCFDFIFTPSLTRNEALNIWKTKLNLTEEQFNAVFSDLDYISQSALISERDRAISESLDRSYVKVGSTNYSIEKKLKDLNIQISKPLDNRKNTSALSFK